MKGAYLLAGIRFGMLLRLLLRHGVSLGARYLFRLLFLLQGSFWASLFALRERSKHGKALRHTSPPLNPVFIVGHWRTGSTFLHQLLALDPELHAPSLFQCSFPDSFMSSRKYVQPILAPMTRGQRPMDNVKLGIDEPQEDEFALLRMTGISPLERLVFARSGDYFLAGDETYLPGNGATARWEEGFREFAAKLSLETGRRPAFKNPFHSFRIPVLKRLFPEAVFIHIYRNPLKVVPSTIHMWSIVGSQNAMRREWRPPTVGAVADVLDRMLTTVRRELVELPPQRFAEIRFEDLERDPVTRIQELYSRLGLPFSETYAQRIRDFLLENRNYKKNRYELDKQSEVLIRSRLSAHMARDNYQ